jgi:hypothetical protein
MQTKLQLRKEKGRWVIRSGRRFGEIPRFSLSLGMSILIGCSEQAGATKTTAQPRVPVQQKVSGLPPRETGGTT